jgi:hypothetical protein
MPRQGSENDRNLTKLFIQARVARTCAEPAGQARDRPGTRAPPTAKVACCSTSNLASAPPKQIPCYSLPRF